MTESDTTDLQTPESAGSVWRLQRGSGSEFYPNQDGNACDKTEQNLLILSTTE